MRSYQKVAQGANSEEDATIVTTQESLQVQAPREFIYRGNAVAAGGFLTKLKGKAVEMDMNTVTTHGESSLPMIGGVSHSMIQPKLPFPNNVSYGTCETFVWGRRVGDTAITTLRASVSNVRLTTSPSPDDQVPNVQSISFQAERIAIEVESTHPQIGQPAIQIKKTEAVGMTLLVKRPTGESATTTIQLDFDQEMMSLTTMEQLDNEFLKNRKFFDSHRALFSSGSDPVFGKSKLPRTPQGYFSAPIVKQVRLGDQVIQGNVLRTKGFGAISFGVMLADGYSRRFSMLRVRMGSDPGGDVGFSDVETNGIWQ
jgi:hypothetical protein